jgi:hypothetical protein
MRWRRTLPISIGGAGSVWTDGTATSAPGGLTVLVTLFHTGWVVTLAATSIFRSSEHRARDLRLLDRTTGS